MKSTSWVTEFEDINKIQSPKYTRELILVVRCRLLCSVHHTSPRFSEEPGSDGLELKFIRPTVFAGFGAISFAFVCQSSSFIVYRSMSHGGLNRWANVTRWSSSIALVMGLTLALGGYLTFGDDTEGNILNNFDDKHEAASAARGFLAVTMVNCSLLAAYASVRHRCA